jgi:hypothetical protein
MVIQSFLKMPALHALAPSVPPTEPPFAIVQGIVLVFFVVVILGVIGRYRPNADPSLVFSQAKPGNHRRP